MNDYALKGRELENHHAEARRIDKQRNSNELQVYLKFFRNKEYIEPLLKGEFYCNTPAYYRANYEPGVGDRQEGVMYAASQKEGGVDPSYRFAGSTIGELLKDADKPPARDFDKLEIVRMDQTYEPGWLQCWFVFTLPKDPRDLGPLATDLHRVRQEFGTDYVFMTSEGVHAVLKRAEEAGIKPMRAAKVGYSDEHLLNSIICKRMAFAYQREFRFIFSKCDIDEMEHKTFSLVDMSDIMHVNPELKIPDQNGTVHLRLSQSELWLNPDTFTARIS